ncbi:hypothetical protein TR51_28515 [Kitasatospora griseola]|uniref:Uncharacterized protein n=1 Tax=Kitasatospora griseola TaxID=2064 RepID=A0A0D0PW90_KITGR|nr:hypothetical protein [Kitasatospora griseola]KIQ62853.1 hypothetical protein TR51_28515 [Kitasatospora griseola]
MNTVDNPYQAHGGRHRGEHRDPVARALTVLWGLGHIITLAVLGIAADHQLSADHPVAAPPARAFPDRDPLA